MKALTRWNVLEELQMAAEAMNARVGDAVLCYSSDLSGAVAALLTNPRSVTTRESSPDREHGLLFAERAGSWPPNTWRVYPLGYLSEHGRPKCPAISDGHDCVRSAHQGAHRDGEGYRWVDITSLWHDEYPLMTQQFAKETPS